MTKLISWNVNGLRACVGKGFLDFFREAEADVFCIQESKLQEGQIELDLPGYHQYWNLSLIHILRLKPIRSAYLTSRRESTAWN